MVDTERLAAPASNGAALAAFACSWSDGSEDAPCVRLTGELDLSTAAELDRTLRQAQARASVAVLDLRELTFIDASGLHVIVNADARAVPADCRLIVVRGARQLDRLLTVTGLRKLFEIVDLDPADPSGDAIRRLAAQIPLDKQARGTNMSAGPPPQPRERDISDQGVARGPCVRPDRRWRFARSRTLTGKRPNADQSRSR